MRKLSSALLAIFALARIATAEWRIVSSENDAATADEFIEHRHLVLEDAQANDRATLDLALFSTNAATLRVIDNARGSENLAGKLTAERCAAGVNGGYFDPDFRPIGLRVIDGATTSPLVRARLLTGVLCASSARGIEIVRVGEFSRRRKLDAALECGPFLVDDGRRVANLDDKRSARRTFAAVARGGRAALGVSSALTLAQLAGALADRSTANDFTISRAMNLDGGSSSAFWFKRNDGSAFSIPEEKPVRDFIGVAAK